MKHDFAFRFAPALSWLFHFDDFEQRNLSTTASRLLSPSLALPRAPELVVACTRAYQTRCGDLGPLPVPCASPALSKTQSS